MATKTLYTVIVADDEDELREAVCTMVPWQEYGFKLLGSASNGLDALQMVEQYEPDLLLTDIRMPFISGIELARHSIQHHQLHAQTLDFGRHDCRAAHYPQENRRPI